MCRNRCLKRWRKQWLKKWRGKCLKRWRTYPENPANFNFPGARLQEPRQKEKSMLLSPISLQAKFSTVQSGDGNTAIGNILLARQP